MPTSRRLFLQTLGTTGIVSLGALPPQFLARAALALDESSNPTAAKSDAGQILVLVQMAGGNDGLNTVVPYGMSEYYKARPALAIPAQSVLKINDTLGFHSTMTGFKELYDEGQLAVVQGVGYPNPDRSHFRSMDIWHSARPDADYTADGWLGRGLEQTLANQSGELRALALGTNRLPLAMLSSKINVPSVSNMGAYHLELGSGAPANQQFQQKLMHDLADRKADGTTTAASNLDFLRRNAVTALTSAEKLKAAASSYQPAATYPTNGLGEKLKIVAQIVAGDIGTRVIFVSLDGFDTHSQQLNSHQSLLAELSSAIRAFLLDLKGHNLHDRVVVATFSEFGRRVEENGSLGTDHGAASQMFIAGAKIKGGLIGAHPSLTDLTEGDLKFHTDFRSVYATLLAKVLGWPADKILGADFPQLNIT